jgi:hypothetical protein
LFLSSRSAPPAPDEGGAAVPDKVVALMYADDAVGLAESASPPQDLIYACPAHASDAVQAEGTVAKLPLL